MRGHTAEQVAAYAPPKSWGDSTGEGVLAHLDDYLEQGVPAHVVYDFHRGYVHDGAEIIRLHKHGCDPATVIDYVPAVMATDDNAARVGSRFASHYFDWIETGATPALIAAFLADHPQPRDVGPAVALWARSGVPPTVAARLHAAGITPTEADTNPDLAAADPDVLATMAALRQR